MVWLGLVLVVAGAVPALTASGDLAGIDLTVAGATVMAVGAVLLVAGILRLRGRRRAGLHGTPRAYYRTSTGKIVAMVVAVVYIVSPVDLIPDVLLPVGIVDDATAFTWLVFALGQEYTRRSRAARRTR